LAPAVCAGQGEAIRGDAVFSSRDCSVRVHDSDLSILKHIVSTVDRFALCAHRPCTILSELGYVAGCSLDRIVGLLPPPNRGRGSTVGGQHNQDRGQGILIVNGKLDVQGGFEFYGPVIVRGALDTQGTGGHFNGGVIAANVDLDQSSVLGDAMVTYSSCAVARAVNGAASGAKLKERSWVNLN